MLVGERITLKPIDLEDTDDIIRWRNQPSLKANFISQEDLTKETHLRWMRENVMTNRTVQFIIIDNETQQHVGTTFIKDISEGRHKGEFGIFIGEGQARGKGFGLAATELITNFGFDVLQLHKIFLRVFESNQAAIRTYEKAGYQMEGLFQDDVFLNGAYMNVVYMANFNRGKK